MQLSYLSRFDHDWYRGLNRGPIGTIISNLTRSHYILMSIVIIGLIVVNFLAAKHFSTMSYNVDDLYFKYVKNASIIFQIIICPVLCYVKSLPKWQQIKLYMNGKIVYCFDAVYCCDA